MQRRSGWLDLRLARSVLSPFLQVLVSIVGVSSASQDARPGDSYVRACSVVIGRDLVGRAACYSCVCCGAFPMYGVVLC